MALPFGGPGGPVSLIQYNEQVVAANHPAGFADVTNRPLEQVMTASGVDFTQIGQNFVGFSLVGHQHHVADIVDFPTIPTSGSGGIPTIATKAALFGITNLPVGTIYYVTEDSQFYYWNGTVWYITVGKYTLTINAAAFGAFADRTVHTISAADASSHVGIWRGVYQVGIDTWDYVSLQEAILTAYGSGYSSNGTFSWNGNNVASNAAIFIPAGNYVINRTLFLNFTAGAYISGAGKDSTIIYSTSTSSTPTGAATTCFFFQGLADSVIENMTFYQFPTSPAVSASLVTMAYNFAFSNSPTTNGYNHSLQNNVFRNIDFFGGSQFSSNDPNNPNKMGIGSAINLPATLTTSIAGTQATVGGDNNHFVNCTFTNCEQAYISAVPAGNLAQAATISGVYNAKFLSCKFNANRLASINAISGSVMVDTCEFNNDPGGITPAGLPNAGNSMAGQQIIYGGYDIVIGSGSAANTSTITNCRSSGFNFLSCAGSGQRVTVDTCSVIGTLPSWKPSSAYVLTNIIVGNYATNTFVDGGAWQCTVAGTSGVTEPAWNTQTTTIVDGTVTWTKLYNQTIVGDAGTSLHNCWLPTGVVSNQIGLIDSCGFSRADWMVPPNTSTTIPQHFNWRNCTVSLNFDPNDTFSAWGMTGGSYTGAFLSVPSTHIDPHYLGTQSAILFRQQQQEAGFDYGDLTYNILGLYGLLGKRTPTGPNANNSDIGIVGGLSTGTGTGGSVRLKVTSPGTGIPSGTLVNSPYDALAVTPTGINIGPSANPILYNVQADYPCTPGTITSGGIFTQYNRVFGVFPGDTVEGSFTQTLTPGLIPVVTCPIADTVRFDIINSSGGSQTPTAGRIRYAVLRRPTISGIPGESAASDVAQLQTDFGGASVFQCFYDSRINVTLSGSNVTKWDDIAGSGGGKGPTLNAGAVPPLSTFGGTVISQASSNVSTLSGASSAFDISGTKTILFGFSFPVNPTFNPLPTNGIVWTLTDGTDYLNAYVPNVTGSTIITGVTLPITYPQFSYFKTSLQNFTFPAVPAGTMIRCGYIQVISSTVLSITIFDQGANSSSINAYPVGSNTFTVFGPATASSSPLLASATHFAIMNTNITGDQITEYRTWCVAKHGMIAG